MRQQELIWVRLPFSSLEKSKVRPAVVVSNNGYNKKNQDIVVCAVTSNLEPKEYSILIEQENLSEGKLPLKSRIRADKIMQIEKNLIIKSFARLDNKIFDALIGEIIRLLQRK